MPNIDPRPFGGPSRAGGVYGNPANPLEWQYQPGDHSDIGVITLRSFINGTAEHVAAVAETFAATPSVTVNAEHIAITAAANGATGLGGGEEAADGGWFPPITLSSLAPVDDEDENLLLVAAVLRHRLRL